MTALILFTGIFAGATAMLAAKCIELKSRENDDLLLCKRELDKVKRDNSFLRLQNGDINAAIDEKNAEIAELRGRNRKANLKCAELSAELQKANRKIYELERRLKMEKVGLKELM